LCEAGAAAKFLRTGSAICAVHESGFGPKRTSLVAPHMSAFGGKADSAQITHLITSGSSAKKFINDFKSRGTAVLTY